MRNGGKWFADLGVANSGGEKLFSMSGHLNNPGNFEIPMGTPFSELLNVCGACATVANLKGDSRWVICAGAERRNYDGL